MCRRGLASPDDGDALALTFAYPVAKRDWAEERRYGRPNAGTQGRAFVWFQTIGDCLKHYRQSVRFVPDAKRPNGALLHFDVRTRLRPTSLPVTAPPWEPMEGIV